MKRVLVLGSGLVARPLIRYLLEEAAAVVTVATQEPQRAAQMLADHPHGCVLEFDVLQENELRRQIAAHDLTVSLLPAPLHPRVGRGCVAACKPLVTTSYISPDMRALHADAEAAGVLLLNEVGLDPGIDHMSALRVIHGLQRRGGRVTGFQSFCGGLPAPDANDNPWGYKFSWSPRGVLTAGKNAARYRENGATVDVPNAQVFQDVRAFDIPGVGALEGYPNRDSLQYLKLYGIESADLMLRGTLRYPGWCRTLQAVVGLGLLDETPQAQIPRTRSAWFAQLTGLNVTGDLRAQVAQRLQLDVADDILTRLAWLGLFAELPLPTVPLPTTALDLLAACMQERMGYRQGERDMVVLRHEFEAAFETENEHVTSTLVAFGVPDGDSAMARTVGLPAAIAARRVLDGTIPLTGVHGPTQAAVYEPVLTELQRLGIQFEEVVERHA